jgi:hypothetical protein
MRQRADRIADNDPSVIENFLKFRGGLGTLMCDQISLATHIDGIERSEERRAQFLGDSSLKDGDCLRGIPMIQCEACVKRGEITVPDGGILRETRFQIGRQSLRSGGILCAGQRKGSAVLDFAASGELKCGFALVLASAALPKNASRTAAVASHRPALSLCAACSA